MKILSLILACLPLAAISQTLGGSTIFNFLKLPASTQLAALGDINISNMSSDAGLAFNNPSLLQEQLHSQTTFTFNSLFAGARNLHLSGVFYDQNSNTTFGGGISYLGYGKIPQTDAAGNILGDFHPADYLVQVSASRKYSEKVRYGAALKFIHSSYGIYKTSGIAADLSLVYQDSGLFQASIILKNMGLQVSNGVNREKGDLPFDLQVGITRKLKNAPFQFSVTAHHIHQFDIRYRDTTFNRDNDIRDESATFGGNLLRHFVVAAQFFPGKYLELTTAYNFLKRKELSLANAPNGLSGFSMGAGVFIKRLQFRYSRSFYQQGQAYHHIGFNLFLEDYF